MRGRWNNCDEGQSSCSKLSLAIRSNSLIDDEVKHNLHPSRMSLLDQPIAILQRAVLGVDVLIVGNVVALIYGDAKRGQSIRQRRRVNPDPHHITLWALVVWRYPNRVDTEVMLKVVERRDDAVKVTDSLIGVGLGRDSWWRAFFE